MPLFTFWLNDESETVLFNTTDPEVISTYCPVIQIGKDYGKDGNIFTIKEITIEIFKRSHPPSSYRLIGKEYNSDCQINIYIDPDEPGNFKLGKREFWETTDFNFSWEV